jgi:hypothetical protein
MPDQQEEILMKSVFLGHLRFIFLLGTAAAAGQ